VFSCQNTKVRYGVASIIVGYLILKKIHKKVRNLQNQRKIKDKRSHLAQKKKNLEESLLISGVLLTDERKDILSKNIEELQSDLKCGKLKPIEVLQAYQAKAIKVDKDTNAVCDFILEASDRAKALEKIPEKDRGPLYGIPISVKECFYIGGYDSTVGLAQYVGKPVQEDCSFVAGIKELHGVPFCITNIPQTMLSWSCSNPVYGNTANPHDKTRTPGGSSGGEAALIASGGSILGLGSDVGGSLRIPAHFCGICGLKPTNGRIYEDGRRGAHGAGMKTLRAGLYSVGGFMSSTVGGLQIGMKAILQDARMMSKSDWRVVPLDWNEKLNKPGRKLRIAYYEEDDIFPLTPGVKRGLKEVIELLKADGHEIIKWNPIDFFKAYKLFADFLVADKGYYFNKSMKYEEIDTSIELNNMIFKTPVFIRDLAAHVINLFSRVNAIFLFAGARTSREIWARNAEKDEMIYNMMREWERQGFDAIISCAFPLPAIAPKYCSSVVPAASYTGIYNLLGNPAGVMPVTTVNAQDTAGLENYPTDDIPFRVAKEACIGAEGCPLGIQVIGKHFEEEMVLHVMSTIESLLRKSYINDINF